MSDLFAAKLPTVVNLFGALAEAQNFRLIGDRRLAPTWKGRAQDNVAAVRLLRAIEEQDRPATPIEQAHLAKFMGFGASDLANGIFPVRGKPCRPGWEQIVADLADATSASEWSSLSRATQYAHYTPEFIVRAIWAAVHRLGFRGGAVLEAGCGTGLFFSLMPDEMVSSSILTGIENDPVTARIARMLHPKADIREHDFTDPELRLPEQCLAIGNPPFSDRIVRGAGLKTTGLSLHEYFIWRSVEALRSGGLGAFVVSRYMMDKANSTARDMLGDIADFLGAIRLHAGALMAYAGTSVVVDLLFLRRRGEADGFGGMPWSSLRPVDTEGTDEPAQVNRYFAEHPEMVLGRHAMGSGQYGPAYTVLAREGVNTEDALTAAIRCIGRDDAAEPQVAPAPVEIAPVAPIVTPTTVPMLFAEPRQPTTTVRVGKAADGATIKEGSYFLGPNGYTLYQVVDGVAKLVKVKSGRGTEGIFGSHADVIRGLIPVRDAVREILRAQEADRPWEAPQARLTAAYDRFVKAHGPINKLVVSTAAPDESGDVKERSRRPNLTPMMDDPDCFLVSSIEEYDQGIKKGIKGPIFSRRVIAPPPERVIHTAVDALAVVLNEAGAVDLDRVAELMDTERGTVIEALGTAVYLDPATRLWETDDAYLSGQVRTKLEQAQKAAAADAAFDRNVAALLEVQPPDLKPSEITARLGSSWISAADIMQFVLDVIGVAVPIEHMPELATWSVEQAKFYGLASATSEWGSARRHAGLLLEDALNARVPQVYDYAIDHSQKIAILNASATDAAKEKLDKIKAAFVSWVWSDTARADRLARLYNDLFNNLVLRRYTGDHLMLPGASTAVTLRKHQMRVIWRIIASGTTYIAHSVGAGKTFEIAAAIMEQRRLGLIDKPMLVVPGHCLAQFSREFLQLYPNAHILVADEINFKKEKRARFIARAATGVWDCIIITHSAFKFISVPSEFEFGMIADEMAAMEALEGRVSEDDRVSRKRLERMKEGLVARSMALRSRKDNMLTMAEIGIDQIVVDEAQEFRKLTFATNMAHLRGIDPNGSQRAWDLYVKSRYVAVKQPRRNLILSSGTPITNTMGEMFTLQRFMQPDVLRERGIEEFDAWAQTFGDTRTELELMPSGLYKPVTRFSEFVNVPELVAMFRLVADVVQKADLREFMTLPRISTGQRQLITAPGSQNFKGYQKLLARRIAAIEARKGVPKKGDDILLSVITDGRHAAIDLRLVEYGEDEPGNKLNLLIANAHRIWTETADHAYLQSDGKPHARPGAAQMIFSDLGTLGVEANRGFSAYRWIKDCLVGLGVPADQIAFMQHHNTSAAKQKLFDAVNGGSIRILIGSSETMGTGVNVQARLKALHHLDVPWLPSQIEQREGRIERQGNQNEEIDLYAYATLGSLDASMWQTNERKAKFIVAVLTGDRTIRRLEDIEGTAAGQFAMAKAIASGDARLMQKAGLEADLARLRRQAEAHYDDQYSVRYAVSSAKEEIAHCETRLPQLAEDMAAWVNTRGDLFTMVVNEATHSERTTAGAALLAHARLMHLRRTLGDSTIGRFAGFDITMSGDTYSETWNGEKRETYTVTLAVERAIGSQEIEIEDNMSALGLIARMERMFDGMELDAPRVRERLAAAHKKLADYEPRLGGGFPYQAELDAKEEELTALNADLAATAATEELEDA